MLYNRLDNLKCGSYVFKKLLPHQVNNQVWILISNHKFLAEKRHWSSKHMMLGFFFLSFTFVIRLVLKLLSAIYIGCIRVLAIIVEV